MGMMIYRNSGTFNPTDYGLKVGDIVNIVAVGGGGGGGVTYRASLAAGTANVVETYGTAGGSSSFGSYVTALGGLYPSQGTYVGGNYGCGAGGWYPGLIVSGTPVTNTSGDVTMKETLGATYSHPSKYGGGLVASFQYSTSSGVTYSGTCTGSNGRINGVGASGATSYCNVKNQSGYGYVYAGGGGAGYGAGGGGASYASATSSSYSAYIAINEIYGGNSGEVKEAVVHLTSLDPIPVTVGAGGVSTTCSKQASTKSGAGADGCVCVFW